MSETKTKNLCTVPAADLTDSQYFIAEDGGELKRIPKAQVVLKKLEKMLATDTENLAGGGEVTAQELLDALAEQVANKLLAKSQVVNNLLATVEGNPLDATQGKALKELIDTTNNNLSKAVYTDDIFITTERPTFVYWNGNTKNTPYKSGLTSCTEGFAFSYGALAGYMTVVCFVKNDSTMWIWSKGRNAWVEYAAKSDLWPQSSGTEITAGTDMQTITTPGHYCCGNNGVAASLKNCPMSDAFTLVVYRAAGGSGDNIYYVAQEYTSYLCNRRVIQTYNKDSKKWTTHEIQFKS
ncbi:MAG: hypothetical protein KHX30_02140 [Clostridium sp.]|nr:hypothetical protein [Clostridium sp.]